MTLCAELTIPTQNVNSNGKGGIPGWNDFVKPYKDKSIFWNELWVSDGKPVSGVLFDLRKFAIRKTILYLCFFLPLFYQSHSQESLHKRQKSTKLQDLTHFDLQKFATRKTILYLQCFFYLYFIIHIHKNP